MNDKQKRIVSKKWTQAAQDQPCTFNIPDICSYRPERTIFCYIHGRLLEKGMRIKTDDIFGADGCLSCHLLMDDMTLFYKAGFTKEDWYYFWISAIGQTLRNRYERGIMKIE